MADNIKATGISPQTQIETLKVSAQTVSNQNLKDSFKSISTNLSVVQVAQASNTKPQSKTSDGNASKLSASLQEAVKYSKQAIKVLEDVTAGELNLSSVEKLLSESEENKAEKLEEEKTSVESKEEVLVKSVSQSSVKEIKEIAEDLEELKVNLTNLFESLKEKATKSAVYAENQRASQGETKDLNLAQEKAESTSLSIQFNGKEALSAHKGLTLNSVAGLLNSGESNRA